MRHRLIWFAVALLSIPGPVRAIDAASGDEPRGLTVVSLNLAMREDVDRMAAELASIEAVRSADLVLLQEVVRRDREPDVASQLGQRLDLDARYREALTLDGERSAGLGLLSRYPLRDLRVLALRRFDVTFRSRNRIAIGAVVDTPHGAISVYNVHLDTRININQRLEQLDAVAREVEALTGPVIIGGDFNTNNNRWLFHTIPLPFIGRQGAGLQRFMERIGFRSAFERGRPTHDTLRMQLDWVFLRGLRTSATSIEPVRMSDHHALIVSLVPDDPLRAESR